MPYSDEDYKYVVEEVLSRSFTLSGPEETMLVSGILNGSVVVKDHAHLCIRGIFNGDLTVIDGGTVEISGIFNGGQLLANSPVTISGIVTCSNPLSRNVTLSPGCIVNGIKH